MKTNGADCKCDDISFKDFALRCSIIAPLADACENKGDKASCEKMDDATNGMEDLLPEHLQDAFADVEDEINKEQFGKFMPKECVEAGAKTPADCAIVMIEEHAPEECKAELKKQKVTNEHDARRICEGIMFAKNTPKECIDAGIKDPRECATLMCKNNFPEKCVNAGLSCEDRNAPRRCEEIMRSEGPGKEGQGFAFGKSCSGIHDKEERLKCFDEVATNVQGAGKELSGHYGSENFGSFNDDFGGRGGPGMNFNNPSNFPPECKQAAATTKEACEKILVKSNKDRFTKQRQYEENFARQCLEKGGRWDCSFSSIDRENPCRCFTDDDRKNTQQFGKDNKQFIQGQGNFPEACRQKNALDPESCRKVMDQQGQQQRDQGDQMRRESDQQRMKEQQDQFRQQQPPQGQCRDPRGNPVPCSQPPQQPPANTQPGATNDGIYSGGYPGGPGSSYPGSSSAGGGAYGGGYDSSGGYVGGSYGGYDSSGKYVGTGTSPPPSTTTSPPPTTTTSPPPSESAPPPSSPPPSGGSVTGGVIADNDFLNYYFR